MKVSLNWVKKYVDLPKEITNKQIAYDLTLRTVEVESVENTSDKFHDIVVGKILEVKEIRVTPNIEEHDFNFKTKNAKKFLEDGSKVKITVRFRGRELSYAKLGEQVLNKFVESLSEVSTLEKKPLLEGKNMFIILAPINK